MTGSKRNTAVAFWELLRQYRTAAGLTQGNWLSPALCLAQADAAVLHASAQGLRGTRFGQPRHLPTMGPPLPVPLAG